MIKDLLKTQIGKLRILAYLEGVSFLLLLMLTMPLKYFMGLSEPNMIIGLIHGLLFIAYVIAVIQIKFDQNWTLSLARLHPKRIRHHCLSCQKQHRSQVP